MVGGGGGKGSNKPTSTSHPTNPLTRNLLSLHPVRAGHRLRHRLRPRTDDVPPAGADPADGPRARLGPPAQAHAERAETRTRTGSCSPNYADVARPPSRPTPPTLTPPSSDVARTPSRAREGVSTTTTTTTTAPTTAAVLPHLAPPPPCRPHRLSANPSPPINVLPQTPARLNSPNSTNFPTSNARNRAATPVPSSR